jgi:hypothetical protein
MYVLVPLLTPPHHHGLPYFIEASPRALITPFAPCRVTFGVIRPPTILIVAMAARADVPDVRFDVVAAKIRSIQYDFSPVYGTASGALIGSSRQLKESFAKGVGKRFVDASDTTAPVSRRRAVAVNPSLYVPLEPSFSTPFPSRFVAFPSAFTPSPLKAMLIDQPDGLVAHHTPRRASVFQHVYRHFATGGDCADFTWR